MIYLNEVDKQLGNWTNDGTCVATGYRSLPHRSLACGPGIQRQTRNCTDGTIDKCSQSDMEQYILCSDAGTAFPLCTGKTS